MRQTRVGDIGAGVCTCHDDPVAFTTVFTTGSLTTFSDSRSSATVGTIGLATCGHTTTAVTGSPTTIYDNQPAHRVMDVGVICGGQYTVITGSGTVEVDGGGSTSSSSALPAFGFQPNTTAFQAAVQSTDDQISQPLSPVQKELFKQAGIDPNQTNPNPPTESTDTAQPSTEVPSDCSDIQNQTAFPNSFALSPNFDLASLTIRCALESHALQAQAGLTEQDIVCNLRRLAVNVLEPVTAQFGKPIVTCGLRRTDASYGSATSDHKLGCAVDLQWPGITDRQYHEIALWLRDNATWSQIIVEYGGNRPWLHVSFNPNKPVKGSMLTRITVPSTYIQGLVACKNVPKVGGTKIA